MTVLYNLAHFDKSRFYIPGETIRQAKDRRRFILWGGLFGLYYFASNTTLKDMTDFCDNIKLKSLDLRDYEDLLKVTKLYLEQLNDSKSNIEESDQKQIGFILKPTDDDIFETDDTKIPNLDNATSSDIIFPEYFIL